MNKLSKLSLKTTGKVLSNREMKVIAGGYSGAQVCAYSEHWSILAVQCEPSATAAGAEANAGEDGWWCCNCEAAKEVCNN